MCVHHASHVNAQCAFSEAEEARALAEVERRRAPLGFRDDACDARCGRPWPTVRCVQSHSQPTLQDYAIAPSLVVSEARVAVDTRGRPVAGGQRAERQTAGPRPT